MEIISYTLQPLYPRHPLNSRLGGPQNRSENFREEKNIPPLPGIELQIPSP